MSKLSDFCDDESEFEDMLTSAESAARPGREEEFVESIKDRFDEYRLQMFMSDKQWEWLQSIADR